MTTTSVFAPGQPLWRQEASHLGRSGATLAFNQVLQIAIPFVTTALAGRLGVDALAAASLVASIGLLLFITSLGVLQGLIPLVSTHLGAGNDTAVVRTVRGSLMVAIVLGVAATAIVAVVPWCLSSLAQDPAVNVLARTYIIALLPSYLPSIGSIALRFLLISANDLRWINPITIGCIAFNLGCNLLLLAGGFDGLVAIGVTAAATNWLSCGLLAIVFLRSRRVSNRVLDRTASYAVSDILSLGIPMGAIFFTETLLFTGSSVLMGIFGTAALAAHGIVTLWLNIALMIPIGISQAATARVAFLLGQRDVAAMKAAVFVALVVGSALSIVVGALLAAGSDSLVALTVWSRSGASDVVTDPARTFFRYCAVTQLLSGLVIVIASVLRGLRDANAALWLVMIGYWGVGLGGAVLFAFVLGLAGPGIWIGIVAAFVYATAVLGYRLVRVLRQLGGRRDPSAASA